MPPVTRLGDPCTGHPCYGARPSDVGCPTVFSNGLNQMGATDAGKGHYPVHCCIESNQLIYTDKGFIKIFDLYKRFINGESFKTISKSKDKEINDSKIINVIKTKKEIDFIKITLENGESFITTKDHQYLLNDGLTYKKADELTYKDIL